MSVRGWLTLLMFVAVFANGCNKNQQPAPVSAATPPSAPPAAAPASSSGPPASARDSELIRQAVEDHLRTNKGINMSAMDMTVDSVTVDGDHAQANATFRVKGGGAAMAMVYSLERQGNEWVVGKSQPSNGEFVHPPMDKTHSGAAASAHPTSGTPDVTDFLKSQPPPKSN
jgi:hypothetical protein